jgi:hypothetical protein
MAVVVRTIVGIVVALVLACGRTNGDAPDLRGTVTRVQRPDASFQALATLYVQPGAGVDADETAAGDTAVRSITLTGASEVYLVDDGKQTRTDVRALESGQRVDVWFVEATAETNPARGQARKIVIYSRA